MPVNIQGNTYHKVPERVEAFREEHPLWTIETELTIEVDFCTARAWVKDETGRVIASATSHKLKSVTEHYIEHSETAAVGRALAFAGYGSPESVASLDDIFEAVKQAKSVEALVNLWNSHPDLQNNEDFVQRFATRKEELTKKSTKR